MAGTEAGKAKILKSVMYPRVLDIYSLCTDELKKSLDHGREFDAKQREEEDNKRLAGLKAETDVKDKMEEADDEEKQRLKLVGAAAKK